MGRVNSGDIYLFLGKGVLYAGERDPPQKLALLVLRKNDLNSTVNYTLYKLLRSTSSLTELLKIGQHCVQASHVYKTFKNTKQDYTEQIYALHTTRKQRRGVRDAWGGGGRAGVFQKSCGDNMRVSLLSRVLSKVFGVEIDFPVGRINASSLNNGLCMAGPQDRITRLGTM